MAKKIKAVLFDFGGVVIENPNKRLFTNLSKLTGIDEGELMTHQEKYEREFERGKITEREYWNMLGFAMDGTSIWREAFSRAYVPRQGILDLAKKLKSNGYSVAGLTNTEAPIAEFTSQRPEIKFFNPIIYSCHEGIAKPESKIYYLTAERMGIKDMSEILFIDDLKENVDSARRCGMSGVVFKDEEQLRLNLAVRDVRVD